MTDSDPIDSFSIIYNSTEIPISKFKFALDSRKFRRISDFISAQSLTVTGDPPVSTFQLFAAGVQGESIEITEDTAYDLLDLSADWETEAFTSVVLDFIAKSQRYDAVCAKLAESNQQRPSHELEAILIEHVNAAIAFPAFKNLSLAALHRILGSPDANVDPHLHLRFVLDMLETFHSDASILASSIDLGKLSGDEVKSLISSRDLVKAFVNPSLCSATLTLLQQNETLFQRVQKTESALELVLQRLETLENNSNQTTRVNDMENRLSELSKTIERMNESISQADKKWHTSLRKTNKTVNGLSRRANETENQLKTLSNTRDTTTRSITDLTKQTADLAVQVLDLSESTRAMRPIECEFGGRSFAGVVHHLTSSVQENDSTVNVTASSSDHNEPYFVADMSSRDVWFSENKPGQWLMYDFGDSRVKVTHYTIRTHKYPPGTCHLKSWVVEGSRDTKAWSELDKRSLSLLNGPNRFQTFPCRAPSAAVRFVRLRQTAANARGDHVLALATFEVFGVLLVPQPP
jgi:hypothetical protein